MSNFNRPKISIFIATSLDSFIARTDGSLDWLDGYQEDYGFKKFLNSVDGVILGRKTYEVAVSAYGTPNWPYQGKRLIILSNTLKTVIEEAEVYSGDLMTLMSQLYSAGIRHVWVDGGVTLSQFLKLNIVDEMTLLVIPVILGSGIPLFHVGQDLPVRLISTNAFSSGPVQLYYKLESNKC